MAEIPRNGCWWGLLGGVCGILGFIEPNAAGGGFGLIPVAAAGNFSVGLLLFMFISRVITTVLCFSGAPGGIFAPMLALGTLLGTAFGMAAAVGFPAYHLDAGTFAVAGMGALLAAPARAAYRDRTGAGNDRQLPAHFANDHYLSRRDTISPIPRWKTAILHHSCPYRRNRKLNRP